MPLINLQREFQQFHEAIKLTNNNENQVLRTARDQLIPELQTWLSEHKLPSVNIFNQGSYDLGTGVKPYGTGDYDIDLGLLFNLSIQDYKPLEVKKWVSDALQKRHRKVAIKEPCVQVQYLDRNRNLPSYHVDLAIYGYSTNHKEQQVSYLARGCTHPPHPEHWQQSDPQQLKYLMDNRFDEMEEKQQFQRLIRYLKRWKAIQFHNAVEHAAPPGIAFTAMAYQWFKPVVRYWWGSTEVNDLEALSQLLDQIIANNYGLDITLPVQPYNNLFEKMKLRTPTAIKDYKDALQVFKITVEKAQTAFSNYMAALEMRKVLGDDFPLPH